VQREGWLTSATVVGCLREEGILRKQPTEGTNQIRWPVSRRVPETESEHLDSLFETAEVTVTHFPV
jgi:hypothetical protein